VQHGESPVVNIDSQRYDRDGFRVSDNSAALTILLNGYAACIILTGVITSSLLSPPSERSEWQRCCFRSMCVCVCVCAQRTGQSDQFKMVKATDFKFDMHVSRDSLDMTP